MSNKFKKIVASLIGIAIIASIALVGCGTEAVASNEPNRFSEEYYSGNNYIITDNETGIQYLFHDDYKAGGMTVLMDEDGKPYVVD